MITGAFNLAAVSITEFTVLEPVTLTAGKANPFSLAYANIFFTSSPVATPGLIECVITEKFE
jgi:hypothetical protein